MGARFGRRPLPRQEVGDREAIVRAEMLRQERRVFAQLALRRRAEAGGGVRDPAAIMAGGGERADVDVRQDVEDRLRPRRRARDRDHRATRRSR
jgi:hypothetical protein